MKRGLVIFAAGTSLLVFFATLALWRRSYLFEGVVQCSRMRDSMVDIYRLSCDHGIIHFAAYLDWFEYGGRTRPLRWSIDEITPEDYYGSFALSEFQYYSPHLDWRYFGFMRVSVEHNILSVGGPTHSHHLGIPCWFVAATSLPLPMLWIRSPRTARPLLHQGRCHLCASALPAPSTGCPECGTTRAAPPRISSAPQASPADLRI